MKFSIYFIVSILIIFAFGGCTSTPTSTLEEESATTSQPALVEPSLTPQLTEPTITESALTWETGIREIFELQCSECHLSTPTGGFTITSYTRVLQGSNLGPIIIPGNPDESHLFYKLKFGGNHPGYMSKEQSDLVWEWVSSGAPE